MKYRIMMDKHACLNQRAHRRLGLEYDQIENLMKDSPPLIGELRLIHMCSQSDGACAMILASEEKAKKISKKPVWIRDHIAIHREETASNAYFPILSENSHRVAARKLFARNGITNPIEYFDVFEMYDPSAWWGIEWLRDFLLLDGDQVMAKHDMAPVGLVFQCSNGGNIGVNPVRLHPDGNVFRPVGDRITADLRQRPHAKALSVSVIVAMPVLVLHEKRVNALCEIGKDLHL